MYWYLVHVKKGRQTLFVKFFDFQANIKAFIPKTEVWRASSGYVIQELLTNYVFIQTNQNKEMVDQHYKAFFKSIGGFEKMLDFDHILALNTSGQHLMDTLFNGGEIIYHSVADNRNQIMRVVSGPLKGLEKRIVDIDVTQRKAILDFMIDNVNLMVPLEFMDVPDV